MVKVTHPDATFSGTLSGVTFVDGHAEGDLRPDQVSSLQRKGCTFAYAEPAAAAVVTPDVPPDNEPPPARNASRAAWAAFALTKGVPSYEAANLSRRELIERVG